MLRRQLVPNSQFSASPEPVTAMLCPLQTPNCIVQVLEVLGVGVLPFRIAATSSTNTRCQPPMQARFVPWMDVLLDSDTRLFTIMHE